MGGRGLREHRWGLLGGTFDPLHFAHLSVAEQVREALALATVLFVPAALPVHKPLDAVSSLEHRLRMVELAIADNPGFRLSRVEADRPAPSYSVDTLEQMVAEHPRTTFYFIVSAEAVIDLPTWRRPQRLLELCRLAVVPRLGYPMPTSEWLDRHFPGQQDRFELVDATRLGHSASDIRARVAGGRTVRYLVPSAVEDYIRENQLYRADD